MTEQQARYEVGMQEVKPEYVKCPNCGRIKGTYCKVGDQVWLARDGELVRVLRSICVCGVPFDFMASEKRLEDLLERLK